MRQIILASTSPRRQHLLKQMGVTFDIVPSDYNEHLDDSRSTEEVAIELGLGKARAVAKHHPKAIVIGSDTIVTLDGKQLGKPTDKAHAEQLLKDHAGQVVTVTTSLALVCLEAKVEEVLADTTTVAFKAYDAKHAAEYIATGDWHDKAGGWSIQVAAPLIEYYQGAIDTVLGLPTTLLAEMLRRQGVAGTAVNIPTAVPRRPRK